MKLDAPDWQGLVTQPHDFSFGGFGRDLEAIGHSLPLHDEGVITSRGEPLRHALEDIGASVLDR